MPTSLYACGAIAVYCYCADDQVRGLYIPLATAPRLARLDSGGYVMIVVSI